MELPETKLEVVEVIQIPDHVNFSRFFKDKVYNIKRTVRKPIKIIYSPVGHEVKSLTIFGNEEAAVNEVKMKIGSLVSSFVRGPKDSLARKPFRKELTHFISIPFNYPEIQDSLKLFKRKVQQLCPELEESLFQNPERMHLTAGVMNLSREQEEEAKLVLNSVKEEVINRIVGSSGQMKVTLQGVSFLGDDRNPNPAKTKVLYAKVTSEHLQAVADSVVKLFMDKKVMDPKLQSSKDGTVKLHVTLMNSTFRTREFERERGKLPRGTKKTRQVL